MRNKSASYLDFIWDVFGDFIGNVFGDLVGEAHD
jgi:hypothetical protein